MARESLPRRLFLAFTFIFIYLWIILFKDLPRLLFQRRKKIENQVVVITGGAMGIGKTVSKMMAIQERAKVCILDVNEVSYPGYACQPAGTHIEQIKK
ncbi:hypothetical protein NECAME_07641 [Necator americanus]|uniref:Uncharacterized protein n=1 Tax=Necator americanus TaxID=51031 RepID=W2TPQ9_NECAM|nr:hypothetical protein NECAME_07641 [Necator americanus]ETN82987.1 hypothetical protein NECAME_07641 [Necator americanus]